MGTPTPSAGIRVLLALMLLLVSGCRLDLAMEVDVARDGSGTIRFVLSADEELLERAGVAGAYPLTAIVEHEGLREEGWTVSEHETSSGREVVLTLRFAGPEAFSATMADLSESLAGPEAALLGPMTMELREDVIVLDGWAALEPGPAVTELGLLPEDAVRLAEEQDFIGFQIALSLPGAVLEHTADEVEGSTLTWRVEPGERRHVRAVGDRPGRALWPFGLAALVLMLGAVFLLRRRQRLR